MSSAVTHIHHSLSQFFNDLPQQPIIVAYSGGVDSQVLLHALATLKRNKQLTQEVIACHVNHGLSDNADLWQQSAIDTCQALNISLDVIAVNLDINSKQSIEELARNARYQALMNVNQQASFIVTGHHSDDQSETFLLALKRGAGIKGLSSMAISMALKQHTLVRPLLHVSRQQIVEYAQHYQLTWHEDESNQDQRFDRNFLRQSILPALQSRWPSISTTINRSAQHCREAQGLLDEVANEDLQKCLISAEVLSVTQLLTLSTMRFNNCVRYFLQSQQKLMPSSEQLKQLHQQLSADVDKNPAVKINNYWLRRYKTHLYLTHHLSDVSAWQSCIELTNANGEQMPLEVKLPDNLGVITFITDDNSQNDLATKVIVTISTDEFLSVGHYKVTEQKIFIPKHIITESYQQLTVKFSHYNPTCLPDYRQKSRPLKKVLQELNIPTWQRARVPFLYIGDELVAALGYFVCQPFCTTNRSPCK